MNDCFSNAIVQLMIDVLGMISNAMSLPWAPWVSWLNVSSMSATVFFWIRFNVSLQITGNENPQHDMTVMHVQVHGIVTYHGVWSQHEWTFLSMPRPGIISKAIKNVTLDTFWPLVLHFWPPNPKQAKSFFQSNQIPCLKSPVISSLESQFSSPVFNCSSSSMIL